MEKKLYDDPFLPNEAFHIWHHAIGFENLFKTEENYRFFLQKYEQYIAPICHTFAFCLMPNHFHLGVKFKSTEQLKERYKELYPHKIKEILVIDYTNFITQQFSNFLNSYAKSFNKYFNRKGSLFLNSVQRSYIGTNRYYKNLAHYINNNPIHHGFCKNAKDWQYSSYNYVLLDKKTFFDKIIFLDLFGTKEEFIEFHKNEPDWDNEEDVYL